MTRQPVREPAPWSGGVQPECELTAFGRIRDVLFFGVQPDSGDDGGA